MNELMKEIMQLSDEEAQFLDDYASLPEDIQILFRLWFSGDPEQSLEAEKTLYDILEQQGHDVSELRESMNRRIETYGR